MENRKTVRWVRVRDIRPEALRAPYALGLARATEAPYLANGAKSMGVHLSPKDAHGFYVTAIVDETSPNPRDNRASLMAQGGTQYGCSARQCGFCVYSGLPFYRDLALPEIVDQYRLALFLHSKTHPHAEDCRKLVLKFTDNGEPLESPALISALETLTSLFGAAGRILRLKVSTVLMETQTTRATLERMMEWQTRNNARASIHLQISRPMKSRRLIGAVEVGRLIVRWAGANPRDRVCVAPGLTCGDPPEAFKDFLRALRPVREHCFVRLSVLKPSTERQKKMAPGTRALRKAGRQAKSMGFAVEPLPDDSVYRRQFETAGTLSHLPNGMLYDPAVYRVLRHGETADPDDDLNIPLP